MKKTSFLDCLYLLRDAGSIKIPLLQIVFVNKENISVKDWFFTNRSLAIQKKSLTHTNKDIILFLSKYKLKQKEALSKHKVCYLIKSDHTKYHLYQHQIEQLLTSDGWGNLEVIALQQYIKYKQAVTCAIVHNQNNEYHMVLSNVLPLWLEHRVRRTSNRIVEVLNGVLKRNKVSKAVFVFLLDKNDKLFLSDITECYIANWVEMKNSSLMSKSFNGRSTGYFGNKRVEGTMLMREGKSQSNMKARELRQFNELQICNEFALIELTNPKTSESHERPRRILSRNSNRLAVKVPKIDLDKTLSNKPTCYLKSQPPKESMQVMRANSAKDNSKIRTSFRNVKQLCTIERTPIISHRMKFQLRNSEARSVLITVPTIKGNYS